MNIATEEDWKWQGDEDRMNKDVVFDILVQCGMVWLMLRLSGRVVGEDGRALEGCEWGKGESTVLNVGCCNTVENCLKIEKSRERKGNKKWCIRNDMGNEDINKKTMF